MTALRFRMAIASVTELLPNAGRTMREEVLLLDGQGGLCQVICRLSFWARIVQNNMKPVSHKL
jgi:hypothetical protein